jgi:hypothetical protein
MKLDTSHAHSEEAITAINNAFTKVYNPHTLHTYREILELILTEWADDKDLLDISKFLENRLQAPIFNGDNEDECEEWSNRE